MSGQEQKKLYEDDPKGKPGDLYQKPSDKMKKVRNVIDDIEGLVDKTDLSKNYKQQGGQ